MPAASCPSGHAVVTPVNRPTPTVCPLAACAKPMRTRSAWFAAAVRNGCPVR